MTPVELVLSTLPNARRNGGGWISQCPAHEDGRASLSIGVGDDGRALIHCYAGCTPETIVTVLGLKLADLMPVSSGKPCPSAKATAKAKKSGGHRKDGPTVYATAQDAIVELERRHGSSSATWTYHNAAAEPVGMIVRWEISGDKDIRPVSKTAKG